MAEYVGKVVYKIELDDSDASDKLKSFKAEFSSMTDSGTKQSNKLSKAWRVSTALIVTATTKAFSAVSSAIKSSVDGAISRVDILNAFPRVMENLGISAEESGAVINDLSEKLNGLPTSLDNAASAVQRFTSKNGDVAKSEEIFLAVNNAILAGGASADIQASALEQLSQAYAKGKPDMMEWRTLQTAMPAQLKQIAVAMLNNEDALNKYMDLANKYAEDNPMSSLASETIEGLESIKNGTGDFSTVLGQLLRSGIISMEEFSDTIVQLNQTGGEEFASFEEQARDATGGIATALTNVENRTRMAIGKIIDAVGQSNISDAINGFSSQFGKLGSAVAAAITGEGNPQEFVQEFVNGIGEAFTTVLPQLGDIIGRIAPILLSAIVGLFPSLLDGLIQSVASLISSLADALPEMLNSIIEAVIGLFDVLTSPETINLLLDAAIKMLMAIVDAIPQVIEALAVAIPRIIDSVTQLLTSGGMIMKILNGAITVFFAIIDAIPVIIQALAEALPDIITSIINFLTSPDTIMMLIEAAVTLFLALVMAVPKILGALLDAFGSLVGGLWEGIKAMFGAFANNFGEFLGSIFKGALNGILGFIENFLNNPIKLINGFIDVINNAFGWLGVNIGAIGLISLPRMYTGGIVPAVAGGMPIIAGDGGEDEWVVPESKMASLVEQLEKRGNMESGNTYNIYVDGVFATSATERRKVADQIIEAINQNDRRRFA